MNQKTVKCRMRPITKKFDTRKAFTIVELLTVMSIIMILMGILMPAMNRIRRYGKRVKQKNQFHSISIALELFNFEQDGYPDSKVLPDAASTFCTTGAHHLAEALVGRDLQGLDLLSTWDAKADEDQNIYGRGTARQISESLDRRQGPYLDAETIKAFQIEELYGDVGTGDVYSGDDPSYPAPVLADVYRTKDIVIISAGNIATLKAGSPILYYKADVFTRIFTYANPENSTYDITDNEALIELGHIKYGASVKHHFDPAHTDPATNKKGTEIFYDAITNHQIRPIKIADQYQGRPHKQDSYILISAGYDGLYGTYDDVFNFGR